MLANYDDLLVYVHCTAYEYKFTVHICFDNMLVFSVNIEMCGDMLVSYGDNAMLAYYAMLCHVLFC